MVGDRARQASVANVAPRADDVGCDLDGEGGHVGGEEVIRTKIGVGGETGRCLKSDEKGKQERRERNVSVMYY